jgi:hypothetical protein
VRSVLSIALVTHSMHMYILEGNTRRVASCNMYVKHAPHVVATWLHTSCTRIHRLSASTSHVLILIPYAHYITHYIHITDPDGNATLCDFGASFMFTPEACYQFEAAEVRAFGLMMKDIAQRGGPQVAWITQDLATLCTSLKLSDRPTFRELGNQLEAELMQVVAVDAGKPGVNLGRIRPSDKDLQSSDNSNSSNSSSNSNSSRGPSRSRSSTKDSMKTFQ